jgi:hypothetical protein
MGDDYFETGLAVALFLYLATMIIIQSLLWCGVRREYRRAEHHDPHHQRRRSADDRRASAKWLYGATNSKKFRPQLVIVNQFTLASVPTAPIGRRDGGRPPRASCRRARPSPVQAWAAHHSSLAGKDTDQRV